MGHGLSRSTHAGRGINDPTELLQGLHGQVELVACDTWRLRHVVSWDWY